MKNLLVLLALVFACALIVGCGGGSLIPNNLLGGSSKSPFAGNWAGTWTDTVLGHNGIMTATIGTNGSVTGTLHDDTTGANGSFTGTISNSGSANWTETYPSITYNGAGTLAINGSGHLLGDIQNKNGNTLVGTLSVDMTKQ